MAKRPNRYSQIVEAIFLKYYQTGSIEVHFERSDIARVAQELGIDVPSNVGDSIYSFRYRTNLPSRIAQTAPEGYEWIIWGAGRSQYKFVLIRKLTIQPSDILAETKIPDSTPGVVNQYALNDEQTLLAKIRYNRLVDIFIGLTCYSLQDHLRTTLEGGSQVETDEIYIGLDKRGAHYVIPVQAKGGKDRIGRVQIEQDYAICAQKFPELSCLPIAAQFMANDLIALFVFERNGDDIAVSAERHYRLVKPGELSVEELTNYRTRSTMTHLTTELLIIGGGSTGTGVAWDAALRGFRVTLVEKRDLTHGTTGRYHGLLHSGARYVVKDPRSAVECIHENRILRRTHTHCIEETGGFFVVTPEDEGDYPDRFQTACDECGVPCTEISVAEALRREPLLNPRISRAFEVPDAAADSFLATHATAGAAAQAGAQILVYHEVIDLLTTGGEGDRRVTGARIRNVVSGEELVIQADLTINASGAWAGRVVELAGITVNVIPGKGTMLAMNHRIVNTVINRCKLPADGDILVPIQTVAVIGTTDERVVDPEHLASSRGRCS